MPAPNSPHLPRVTHPKTPGQTGGLRTLPGPWTTRLLPVLVITAALQNHHGPDVADPQDREPALGVLGAARSAAGCPGCGVVSVAGKVSVITRPVDLPYGETSLAVAWHKRRVAVPGA